MRIEDLPSGRMNSISQSFLPDMRVHVEAFGIHLRTVNRQWHYPIHEHPHYELNYVLEGQQITTINGRRVEQEMGDLLLIPPCHRHSSHVGNSATMTYFCLHFLIEDKLILPQLSQMEARLVRKDTPLWNHLKPALEALIALTRQGEAATTSVAARLSIQSVVFQFMAQLADYLSQQAAEPTNRGPSQLARAIEEHIFASANAVAAQGAKADHKTYINQIAQELGIHPTYCTRVFRSVYGISPRQYLSELVLNHAINMLSQSKLSVEHIASVLGYADTSQFSRQFKRWTGLSPNQYRRERLNPEGPLSDKIGKRVHLP